ncbi:MAG: hypothetical protein QOF72_1401, partial [Blastocatellia bacterium]|nr:hypothetical protein [Blastocatellia bacterium]
ATQSSRVTRRVRWTFASRVSLLTFYISAAVLLIAGSARFRSVWERDIHSTRSLDYYQLHRSEMPATLPLTFRLLVELV